MSCLFYKSFDSNLCGRNNYQFKIGKTFSINTPDKWIWFHYSQYLSSTLIHSSREDKNIRICLVEPKGEIYKFKATTDGYNKGYNYTTNKLFIHKELTQEEILKIAYDKEKFKFTLILGYLNPPYEWLYEHKNNIRGTGCILNIKYRDDLSIEQKLSLMPKIYHKYFIEGE